MGNNCCYGNNYRNHVGMAITIGTYYISFGVLDVLNEFLNGFLAIYQRVVINCQSSNWSRVKASVPQGSILGPLLFLLFIYDIVKHINASIRWVGITSKSSKTQRLVLFYRMLHGLTPNYLSDLDPILVQETAANNLCDSYHIHNYRANFNLFLNSFISSIIKA